MPFSLMKSYVSLETVRLSFTLCSIELFSSLEFFLVIFLSYTYVYVCEDLLRYKETTLHSMEMIEVMVLCQVGEPGYPLIVGGEKRD